MPVYEKMTTLPTNPIKILITSYADLAGIEWCTSVNALISISNIFSFPPVHLEEALAREGNVLMIINKQNSKHILPFP